MENEEDVFIEEEVEEETVETESPKENERPAESLEAKKARLERQLKQLEKKNPDLFEKSEKKSSKKSDDFDYGQEAFFIANGIKGDNEAQLVKDIMRETGKNAKQVLGMKYFQAELNEMRELGATSNATISGKRSGNVATDSVEYWMGKDFKDVPADMKAKVVNARLAKNQKGTFYNS